jgi:DNA-binding NtrC family response regulator
LIRHYIHQYEKELDGAKIKAPGKKSIDRLCKHPWPGNVRELQKVIEWIMVFGDNEAAFKYQMGWVDAEIEDSAKPPVFELCG